MHNKIQEALEPLGIDTALMEYTGNSDEYIVFSIYNSKDTDLCDDTNLSETHYITINYWFKSLNNLNKYKEIKKSLKANGFTFDGGQDRKEKEFYGKSMDFIYYE